jgi:hypothetical protein
VSGAAPDHRYARFLGWAAAATAVLLCWVTCRLALGRRPRGLRHGRRLRDRLDFGGDGGLPLREADDAAARLQACSSPWGGFAVLALSVPTLARPPSQPCALAGLELLRLVGTRSWFALADEPAG